MIVRYPEKFSVSTIPVTLRRPYHAGMVSSARVSFAARPAGQQREAALRACGVLIGNSGQGQHAGTFFSRREAAQPGLNVVMTVQSL